MPAPRGASSQLSDTDRLSLIQLPLSWCLLNIAVRTGDFAPTMFKGYRNCSKTRVLVVRKQRLLLGTELVQAPSPSRKPYSLFDWFCVGPVICAAVRQTRLFFPSLRIRAKGRNARYDRNGRMSHEQFLVNPDGSWGDPLRPGWELRLFASGWMFAYYALLMHRWFPRHGDALVFLTVARP